MKLLTKSGKSITVSDKEFKAILGILKLKQRQMEIKKEKLNKL